MTAVHKGTRPAGLTTRMNEPRPHPRHDGAPLDDTVQTRAELVRYFAWGYLSRRELTARLRRLDQTPTSHSRRAGRATSRAA